MTEPLTHSRFSLAPGVAEKLIGDLLQVNLGDKAHLVRGEYVEPALDDADSLVTFGIQLPASQQVRKMVSGAIEEAA